MKLLKDFTELEFKNIRKTDTGSRIIDIDNVDSWQTPWMKIVFEVEYNICVNAEKIQEILEAIDKQVIKHASECLDFSEDEIQEMYKPLLRTYNDMTYLSAPITSNTVLFDRERNFYSKSEIKKILKVNQYVRFIIRFKKIYFKDHILSIQFELQQVELA